MKDRDFYRIALLTPTVFIFTLIVVAVFGAPGDPWFDFISSFQTLIAGFMAVLAATITVYQMRSSDSKLEKRHIEILEINRHPKIFVRQRRERLAEEIEFFLELIDMNSKIEYYIEGNVQNPKRRFWCRLRDSNT